MALLTPRPEQLKRKCDKKTGACYFQVTKSDPLQYFACKTLKTLGTGMSGEVKLVRDDNFQLMAAKIISIKDLDKEKSNKRKRLFFTETSILGSLKHPNIVRGLKFVSGPTSCTIFMDYIPDGNLFQRIPSLSNDDIGRFFIQIGSALRYVHAKLIVHRDVKPTNILINGQTAILCDFGLAKRVSADDSTISGMAGSRLFLAPEVALPAVYGEWFCGYKADSFSLGKCLWMMVMKKISKLELSDDFREELETQGGIDPILKVSVLNLTEPKPAKRMDITRLLTYLTVVHQYRCEEIIELAPK